MWTRRSGEGVTDGVDDALAAGPPQLVPILGYGVFLPLLFAWWTMDSWLSGEAWWWADSSRMKGQAARAMSVAYAGVALFLHGRNCWGAMGFAGTQRVLLVLGCLAFIGGTFTAMVLGLGGV